MYLKINSLEKNILLELRKVYKQSKEGDNLLSISELKYNNYLINQLILAIICYLILMAIIYSFPLGWKDFYWVSIALVIFSFFLSKFFYLLHFYLKFNKSFLYFDEEIVIIKYLEFIEIFPLKNLSSVKFKNTNTEKYITLSDGKKRFSFQYKKKTKELLKNFAGNLVSSSNAKKRNYLIHNRQSSTLLTNLLHNNESKKETKYKIKFLVISVVFTSLILLFINSLYFDWNSFREAKIINTATSFRNYLNEDMNHLYRNSAKEEIEKKYNEAINIYKGTKADDKNAIIKILQYLKDNEIYYVDILFKNENRIKDISKNYDVKIKSAESSFTTTKNKDRETKLISTLNKTLGSIFPSDIISIEKIRDRMSIPKIEIIYSYTNSEDGSLYYPVAQENMHKHQRDYYYGLTIYWYFKLFVPSEKNPIYSFTLKSNPAVQFSAETSNTDNVYSNMVYSAFRDFDTEFRNHFLGN